MKWNGISMFEYVRDIGNNRYRAINLEQLATTIKEEMNRYYQTNIIDTEIEEGKIKVLVQSIKLCTFEAELIGDNDIMYITLVI